MDSIRQTSLESINKLKASGALTTRRFEVYEALAKCGPATTNKLKRYMRPIYGDIAADSAEKRISELCEMGLAVEVGSEIDPATDCRGIVWSVTERTEPLPLLPRDQKSTFDIGYRKALIDFEGEIKRRMLLPMKDQDHCQYAHRVVLERITSHLRTKKGLL